MGTLSLKKHKTVATASKRHVNSRIQMLWYSLYHFETHLPLRIHPGTDMTTVSRCPEKICVVAITLCIHNELVLRVLDLHFYTIMCLRIIAHACTNTLDALTLCLIRSERTRTAFNMCFHRSSCVTCKSKGGVVVAKVREESHKRYLGRIA